ncbi:hypothetical protein TIFTF001_027638 [Ficus carica]|uniref:Uncharacterized protein n=1 Tax=Ficus carica TaxID=3494 RepID=A0AA88J0J0_FICCA|nr:hypothetical protein TIFTF001_025950 [Ficus carica]GMN58536.1 hypothetical protein TIFTF001_027638 [Ficus carica]
MEIKIQLKPSRHPYLAVGEAASDDHGGDGESKPPSTSLSLLSSLLFAITIRVFDFHCEIYNLRLLATLSPCPPPTQTPARSPQPPPPPPPGNPEERTRPMVVSL